MSIVQLERGARPSEPLIQRPLEGLSQPSALVADALMHVGIDVTHMAHQKFDGVINAGGGDMIESVDARELTPVFEEP